MTRNRNDDNIQPVVRDREEGLRARCDPQTFRCRAAHDRAAIMPTDPSPTPVPQQLTPRSILLRSLLPFAAVGLLLSTIWIGPFGFLAAAVAWWQIVRRIH